MIWPDSLGAFSFRISNGNHELAEISNRNHEMAEIAIKSPAQSPALDAPIERNSRISLHHYPAASSEPERGPKAVSADLAFLKCKEDGARGRRLREGMMRDRGWTTWFRRAATAVLAIPCAIIPEAENYALNPAHPDFKRIRFGLPESFSFDPRLAALLGAHMTLP